MYYESSDPDAKTLSVNFSQGGRSKQTRRQHAICEARNGICAHIKRDDASSRRFIQYLSMQSTSWFCLSEMPRAASCW